MHLLSNVWSHRSARNRCTRCESQTDPRSEQHAQMHQSLPCTCPGPDPRAPEKRTNSKYYLKSTTYVQLKCDDFGSGSRLEIILCKCQSPYPHTHKFYQTKSIPANEAEIDHQNCPPTTRATPEQPQLYQGSLIFKVNSGRLGIPLGSRPSWGAE